MEKNSYVKSSNEISDISSSINFKRRPYDRFTRDQTLLSSPPPSFSLSSRPAARFYLSPAIPRRVDDSDDVEVNSPPRAPPSGSRRRK